MYNNTGELKINLKNLRLRTLNSKNKISRNFLIKGKIKLCHLDINVYEDTIKSFLFVDKHIVKNGIIIFDDYGIFKVDGILKAIKK